MLLQAAICDSGLAIQTNGAISGSDTFANCVPILKVTVCPQSGQGSGLIGFQIATVSLEEFEFKMKRGLQISGSNQCSR
jgi:hypothetical protein